MIERLNKDFQFTVTVEIIDRRSGWSAVAAAANDFGNAVSFQVAHRVGGVDTSAAAISPGKKRAVRGEDAD